jgi:lipopolysaccharide export system protein LptA
VTPRLLVTTARRAGALALLTAVAACGRARRPAPTATTPRSAPATSAVRRSPLDSVAAADSARRAAAGLPPGQPGALPASAPTVAGPAFSVQVGAYADRAQADEAVLRLRLRRIDARVEGQGPRGASPPFRVRVGRFATRAAADAERRALAARGTVGFVAEAAPAPRAPVAAPAPTVAQSPLDLAADDAATAGTRAARARRNAERAQNPASRCRTVNLNDSPPTARLNSLSDGRGGYISYIGGGAVARCEGVNNVLRADSAEYYQAAGLLVLVNSVSYDEPARARLTANRVTYYTADERIVAEGNVVVTLPTGTTMTGPSAEYLRDAPPLRLASRLTAPGRPTVRIVGGARGPARSGARPAGRADTSITTIVANTVIDEADSVVYASGQVDITRTDVVANADSAVFEQDSERARLLRNARIRGTRGRPFTMTGAQIDLYTRERELSRVLARQDARVVSDSLTLRSDTVDLRLPAGLLQFAYAWGPSRATAVSPERNLVADSIAAYLPSQRVREIRALRRAVATTRADTARVTTTERDVLRGDTVVARFDSAAAARDTNRTPPVEQLVAAGNASSLFHLASREGKAGRPSVNYVRGRVITVDFDSGAVREVTVIGRSDGVYLEPSDSTAAPSAAGANGTAPRPGAPRASAPARPAPAIRPARPRGSSE